jgi:hypothetical protein
MGASAVAAYPGNRKSRFSRTRMVRRRNGFVQASFLLPIVHALQKHFSLLIQLSSNQPH